MPSITGRVCFHPCMDRCTRKDYDQAVNIPAIERFLGDMGLDNPEWMKKVKALRKEKVAVVGGGPAGLSCAFYLSQMGYPVTIFEAEKALGGVLRWGIPEYRLPNEILDRVVDSILGSGPIDVKTNTLLGRDFSLEELKRDYKAVFVGIGLSRSRKLGIDGEDIENVTPGLEFLKAVNSGEKVTIGKDVVVVGGGNTAMDVARTAMRLGADEVMVLYRRTEKEMPAAPEEVEEAREEGVHFEFLVTPKSISRDGDRVTLEMLRMELGEPDESGRRRPIPIDGSEYRIEVDTCIMAIGQKVENEMARELNIKLTRWGTFEVDPETLATNVPGIFAGGDCETGPDDAIRAIASGKKAAFFIDKYLKGEKL